jgi:Brp/Blh family beta-carotene 15,15'-monooxygenase
VSPRPLAYDRFLWAFVTPWVVWELVAGPGMGPVQQGVAALSFLTLGVSHGALDRWLVARWTGAGSTRFYSVYLGLAVLQAVLWWKLPQLALATFLLGAVMHFGLGEVTHPRLSVFARTVLGGLRGALLVGLPFVVHPQAVAPVLTAMGVPAPLEGSDPSVLVAVLVASNLAVLPVLGRPAGAAVIGHEAVQVGVLSTILIVLPPLLSFSLYFAWWHGVAHGLEVKRTWGERTTWPRLLEDALPFALLAVAGLLTVVMVLPAGSFSRLAGLGLVGVSVLTTPHLVVVHGARGRWPLTALGGNATRMAHEGR